MEKKRVLVVDDEPDSIEFVKVILENEDFAVLSAQDGMSGLEKAKAELPDLIILDVQMPRMSGFDVFGELRKLDQTKDIPVIMLTGIREKVGIGFDASEMESFFGNKPQGYLEKPIEPETLIEKVKESLKE